VGLETLVFERVRKWREALNERRPKEKRFSSTRQLKKEGGDINPGISGPEGGGGESSVFQGKRGVRSHRLLLPRRKNMHGCGYLRKAKKEEVLRDRHLTGRRGLERGVGLQLLPKEGRIY